MKKLMIALAAVAMAIGAQAAAANWQATATNIYNGKGDSAAKWSGTAYIYYVTASITQESIFDDFAAGTDVTASAIATGTVSAGAITAANAAFSYGEQGGGSYSYFFALIDGDNIYLSKTVTQTANGTATAKTLGFGNQAPTSGATSRSLPTDGFVAVGQWAAAPEPTSGLLLLLGVAGLALKRKRA